MVFVCLCSVCVTLAGSVCSMAVRHSPSFNAGRIQWELISE